MYCKLHPSYLGDYLTVNYLPKVGRTKLCRLTFLGLAPKPPRFGECESLIRSSLLINPSSNANKGRLPHEAGGDASGQTPDY